MSGELDSKEKWNAVLALGPRCNFLIIRVCRLARCNQAKRERVTDGDEFKGKNSSSLEAAPGGRRRDHRGSRRMVVVERQTKGSPSGRGE
jgi:hypothetical protein